MWVKHNEDNEVVSIFMGCTPTDTEGYTDVPDDHELFEEYRIKHDVPVKDTPTQEERTRKLEEELKAAKLLLGLEV